MGLSHQEAEEIVYGLSDVLGIPAPEVYYADDEEMKRLHYWAFCYPAENYIVFRENEIPQDTPAHETMHLAYYRATGDPNGHKRSEGIAQWAGSLWTLNGPELLSFTCQVCGNPDTKLSFDPSDGSFTCRHCGATYDWMIS